MPGGLRELERVIGLAQGVPQVAHPRGGDLQRPGPQAEDEFHLPAVSPCRAAAFSASTSASSCAEPMCSMFRDPRREDHAIWTAVALEAVFTVRPSATRRDYESRISAQIRRRQPTTQQFTALRPSRSRSSDKSQVAQQHNHRGFTTREPEDGGGHERTLAEQERSQAAAIADS